MKQQNATTNNTEFRLIPEEFCKRDVSIRQEVLVQVEFFIIIYKFLSYEQCV